MNPALSFILTEYLRSYQTAFLRDGAKFRIALKARQIGWSDIIALEMVLVASGIFAGFIQPADCNIVSRQEKYALDVIRKAKKWHRILYKIKALQPFLEKDPECWSKHELGFLRSGFRIISETQNPDAARGSSGHIYLDEYAFYAYQRDIWLGAVPSTFSKPGLRVTVVSTPNGFGDHYHEIWTNMRLYGDYSRHKCDVYEAVAAGFPLDIEAAQKNFEADGWEQEMECKFIGGENEYFGSELLQDTHMPFVKHANAVLWLGIDTASVVDTTAIQEVWVQPDGIWFGDTYVLQHIQYETDVQRKRLGQVTIVDAVMRKLAVRGVVIDVTGDMARRVQGIGSLYTLLLPMHTQMAVLPQAISTSWKDKNVQELKVGLGTRSIRFVDGRRDFIYSAKHASQFIEGSPRISDAMVAPFMREAFSESKFPVLIQDFRKVYRKWTSATATTFDVKRDGQGHGDSFWAAVLGYSVAKKAKLGGGGAKKREQTRPAAPVYAGYI
jgi:hypothetical protein